MGNLSKANFFDAGTNPPKTRIHVERDGTRRLEKLPNGRVERFVDSQGNVVFQQLVPPGQPQTIEAIDARRAEIRRRRPDAKSVAQQIGDSPLLSGQWIEFHLCPLSQGTLDAEQFPEQLQRNCPKGSYGVDQPCVHVLHVIDVRQREQHDKRDRRDAAIHAEKQAREQRELEAARAQQELNANLAALVGHVAKTMPQAPQAATPAGARADGGEDKPEERKKRDR